MYCCNHWDDDHMMMMVSIFFFFLLFKFYFIFKLYIIVLVLPNIKMNPTQVYMCSPSWTLLPPPSPYHPSGSSQCTSPKHPVPCIEPGLATRFLHDILHVSMPFSLERILAQFSNRVWPSLTSHIWQPVSFPILTKFTVVTPSTYQWFRATLSDSQRKLSRFCDASPAASLLWGRY